MRLVRTMLFTALVGLGASATAGEIALGEDGLHKPAWLDATTGDLREDARRAAARGKTLMLLIEQRGCLYCLAMHTRNFQRSEVVDLLKGSFAVIQLDLQGARELTGFDGKRATEAALMRKWRVTTTPTTIVLRQDIPAAAALSEVEAFRLPGYLKPFEHYAVLDYFASGAFETEELRAYMLAKAEALTAEGIDPASW